MINRIFTFTTCALRKSAFLSLVCVAAAAALGQEPASKNDEKAAPNADSVLAEIEADMAYAHAGKYEAAVRKMSKDDRVKFFHNTMKWTSLDYRPQSSKVARIESALEDETAIEFIETPLQDVVEFLSDFHGIPIVLDHEAFKEAGFAEDSGITFTSRGASLQNALTTLLGPHKLDFMIANDMLKITSQKRAAEHMQVRVYETRWLKHLADNALMEVVQNTVEPASWRPEQPAADDHRRATITTIPGGLVVSQSWRNHEKIADLLRQLIYHQTNPLFDPKPAE